MLRKPKAFPDRLFYGWVIVCVLFTVNFSIHATGLLNYGLFILPMANDLGLSRNVMGWVVTARALSAVLSSFFIGRLLDRYGPRLLIPIAALGTGAAMLGIANTSHAWQLFLFFGVIGLMGLSAPAGAVMTSVPIAKWFVRRRGRAMSITALGLGIGAVAFLPLTQVLISGQGWRSAWIVLAIIHVVMAVPLAVVFLRRQPEDVGMTPDGDLHLVRENPDDGDESGDEVVWTVRDALRTKALWKLVLALGLVSLGLGMVSIHRIPYWVERGFDERIVSYAFAADAAAAAVMVLITGVLVEKCPTRIVAGLSYLMFLVAVGFMLLEANSFFLFASSALFGAAVGVHIMVQGYVWADYYGREFLGAIRGVVFPVTLLANGVGAPMAGYIFDLGGSYVPAWWVSLGVFALATLIMLSAIRPRHHTVFESGIVFDASRGS
jgi:MFS family permease